MVYRPVVPNAANYATLREIEDRLKSIRNIEKITKTMKIVASTKLNRAQRAMTESRSYGQTSNTVFQEAETKHPEGEGRKSLIVVASSDKGLCGGIHSGLTRYVRKMMIDVPDADLVILGEKCKAQLGRSHAKQIRLSFGNVGKDVPTFSDAQAIADQICLLPTEYTDIQIIYNRFINATSYEPTPLEAFSEEAIKNSPNFAAFEIDDEVLSNLREYALANSLFWALAEGHACEQSARRNAMDVRYNPPISFPQSPLICPTECLKECRRHDQQIPNPLQPHAPSRHYGRVGRDHHRSRSQRGGLGSCDLCVTALYKSLLASRRE